MKLGILVERSRTTLRLITAHATDFVKVRLGLVLFLVLVTALLTALTPLILKFIVDTITGDIKLRGVGVMYLIGAYVVAQWLSRTLTDIRTLVYVSAEQRLARSISHSTYDHIVHLPLQFHINSPTGATTQTLTMGMQGLLGTLQIIVFTLLPVITELLTVAAVLIYMAQIPFLTLFFASLTAYALTYAYGTSRVVAPARTASQARIDAHAVLIDSAMNNETVKYCSAERLVASRFDGALARVESTWFALSRRVAINNVLVASVFAVFLALTLFYAGVQVSKGTMTAGDFVLVSAYILQIVRPVEAIGAAAQQLTQNYAQFERMFGLLQFPSEKQGRPPHEPPLQGRGAIEFENVSFAFRPDRKALDGVNMKVAAGKSLGIVGVSGAGKSTLVRILTRLVEPASGRVLIDGVPTTQCSIEALRAAIAVVPQETALFDDTIAFNISCARPDSSRQDIEHAAKMARLHDFIAGLPEGYETRVGERGVKLSGGERQRVSIARAVLKRPLIYVFDEATSSLDSGTEREILKNFREVSASSTTLMIAHRLSTIVDADEIVVLEHGAVVEQGTHESLLRLNGRYAALWSHQQKQKMEVQPAA